MGTLLERAVLSVRLHGVSSFGGFPGGHLVSRPYGDLEENGPALVSSDVVRGRYARPLPFIGVGYAVASGGLFGSEVEPVPASSGTVSTAVRTVSATSPSIVSSAASRLFYTDGKGPRADRFAVSDTPDTPFVTASLTGMVGLPKGAGEDAAEAKDEEAEKGARRWSWWMRSAALPKVRCSSPWVTHRPSIQISRSMRFRPIRTTSPTARPRKR